MRKTLNVVLAVVLALAMFGGMAYIVTPERTSEYQISLVSAKAVTIQDATQGIRSYSDLVDTTKGFQVNEIINVAITAEVKNLEKPASNNKYKSIADKDIKVVVGSPNIDFNVARLSSPTLLTHVWSGYTGQNVATVGYVMHAGEVLKYDKAANEISWTFRGRNQYAMVGSTTVGYNLVTFDPQLDDGKIVIPAIKLQDRKEKWTLGSWSYDITQEAPESIAYTMVLTGVTMDNAGAATGEFYAKIQISGAEKFQDEATYYVDYNGKAYDSAPTSKQISSLRTGVTEPLEWLDYVEIDVDKLEIAGGYNVYRYDVPASAILADIPIIYGGEYDDFNGSDTNNENWYDGEVIAEVQPQIWDWATKKDNATTANVAGGVKSMKAYDYYQDGSKSTTTLWTKTSDYPVTSVIYSTDKAYYAPGFYGGYETTGRAGADQYYSSEAQKGTPGYSDASNTETLTVVDYFYVDLPKSVVQGANLQNVIQVWKADQLIQGSTPDLNGVAPAALDFAGVTAIAGNSLLPETYADNYTEGIYTTPYSVPMGNTLVPATNTDRLSEKVEYSSHWIEANGKARVIVTPLDTQVSHTLPLERSPIGNQWVVFYYDPANASDIVVPFVAVDSLNHSTQKTAQGNAFMEPQLYDTINGGTYNASSSGVAAPLLEASIGTADQLFGNGSVVTDTANAAFEANYIAKAFGAYAAGTAPTILDYVKNYAASTMLSWPVFTEVHKEITVPVGNGNKPVLTVGALRDASVSSTATSDLFPLEYASQITAIRFYDTVADSTLFNDSAMVVYSKDWTPSSGAITGFAGYGNVGTTIFASAKVNVINGESFVELGDAYQWDVVTNAYKKVANQNTLYLSQYVVVSMNKGKVDEGYAYNGAYAAPTSLWDISANEKTSWHIKYHNGIVVYTICANSNDRPWISMATENTQFNSDDGYGIALFDSHNASYLSKRIYRSNDSNLSYSDGTTGHVNESASMIAAQKYFALDTSYGTTFQVKDDTFENKGAAAVFSDNITGSFKYGDLVIIGETIEEGTEEEVIEDPVEDEPIEDEPVEDEPVEDEPVEDEPAPVAPPTGDGSANVAIALAAAAIVAAAGLAFVMKKVR